MLITRYKFRGMLVATLAATLSAQVVLAQDLHFAPDSGIAHALTGSRRIRLLKINLLRLGEIRCVLIWFLGQ